MQVYKIKKLIDGFKVNPYYKGRMLIAVPKDKLLSSNFNIIVLHNNDFMVINAKTPILQELMLEDKYGRTKTYTLVYFEWKPTQQISLLN